MTQRNHYIKSVFIFILFPLFIGGILYYLFCPTVDFVKVLDNITHLNVHISVDTNNLVVSYLRFYLFDFIWAFAFSSTVYLFFTNKRIKHLLSLLIPIVFGVIYEILQKNGVVNGTFDIGDIIAEIIAVVISVYLNICYETRRKRNEENN